MIIARSYTDVPENDFRALLHCAQYAIEQLTGRAVYRDGLVPTPSSSTVGQALKALQAAKKENVR